MSVIDKELLGSNFCGLSCTEQNAIIHPVTCVDQVLTAHDSQTLHNWFNNHTVPEGTDPFVPFEDTTGLLDWLIHNYHLEDYSLQPATDETLGGVKIGNNINVDNYGTISVTFPTLPKAEYNLDGVIKLGNNTKIPSEFSDDTSVPCIDDDETNKYYFPLLSTNENRAGVAIEKGMFSELTFNQYHTESLSNLNLNILSFNNSYISDPQFTILDQLDRIEEEFESFENTKVYPIRLDESKITIDEEETPCNALYVYVPWENTTYNSLNSVNHDSNTQYVIKGPGSNSGWGNKFLKSDGTWEPIYETLSISAHANGTNYVINGIGSNIDNTKYLRSDGTWNVPNDIATQENTSGLLQIGDGIEDLEISIATTPEVPIETDDLLIPVCYNKIDDSEAHGVSIKLIVETIINNSDLLDALKQALNN